MKCLSLFSGIGGFDLALTRLGHEIVGACEIDKYARQVYAKHFPNVRIWEDATKIRPEELPDFDILCAGFPCQAFSIAGRRLGFEESRGTLFHEIARIARQKRPRYLFLENVRGLLYHDEGRTLTTIIQVFHELGYDLEWQVINSKHFVPQNRERIFIIGHLRGESTRKIFPISETFGHSSKENKKKNEIASTLPASYYKQPSDGDYVAMLCVNRENKRQNGRRLKNIGEPSFTLTAQDRHGVYDGNNIRMFTPLECERLQGFPDNWTEGISDTQRYKCIGNAVTVPVIEFILKRFSS